MFGDEMGAVEGMTLDLDDMPQAMNWLFRIVGQGQPALNRFRMIARLMAAGPGIGDVNHIAQAESFAGVTMLSRQPQSLRHRHAGAAARLRP
jgi:hypothetical protein